MCYGRDVIERRRILKIFISGKPLNSRIIFYYALSNSSIPAPMRTQLPTLTSRIYLNMVKSLPYSVSVVLSFECRISSPSDCYIDFYSLEATNSTEPLYIASFLTRFITAFNLRAWYVSPAPRVLDMELRESTLWIGSFFDNRFVSLPGSGIWQTTAKQYEKDRWLRERLGSLWSARGIWVHWFDL